MILYITNQAVHLLLAADLDSLPLINNSLLLAKRIFYPEIPKEIVFVPFKPS